ncbi:MAG: hypothetical protein NC926_04620 [Candidatus Omnitrophica bacterium]|nr:hypothetical protein [Candidatus Omnitrophota bacterium]
MERKKLTLLVLTIVLILLWAWQLKPKKKKINIEPVIEEKEIIAGINLREIEENFSEIKKKIVEIENINKANIGKITIQKNPLKPWILRKESLTKEEKEPEKPNFKISGIVQGSKKSYVIIDNEVKEEGETIGNFIIFKIYPEKVILKDMTGNFFTLNFEFEQGGNNEKQ